MRALTCEKGHDSLPTLAQVLRGSEHQHSKGGVQGIHAVVEKLAQWARLAGSSPAYTRKVSISILLLHPSSSASYSPLIPRGNVRLRSIHGIKSLVQEQPDSPAVVDPARAVLVECWSVPQQGQEVDDDEHESGEGDHVGRHAEREALDDHMRVEGLQNVFGHQRPVHPGVLVLLEGREVPLPYVNHLGLIDLL